MLSINISEPTSSVRLGKDRTEVGNYTPLISFGYNYNTLYKFELMSHVTCSLVVPKSFYYRSIVLMVWYYAIHMSIYYWQ